MWAGTAKILKHLHHHTLSSSDYRAIFKEDSIFHGFVLHLYGKVFINQHTPGRSGHHSHRFSIFTFELGKATGFIRICHDKLVEPGGHTNERDVIRHNGSVVILAMDTSKSKKNPWIVIERQYRHAAGRFLWELPAGKLEAGEDALLGAQRELEEETGYKAKRWKPLVEYYASPGFLGESMKVFVAEGLVAGNAHPEEDEQIEIRLVKLSEVVKLIEKGAILDGKTLSSVLLFARKIAAKHGK